MTKFPNTNRQVLLFTQALDRLITARIDLSKNPLSRSAAASASKAEGDLRTALRDIVLPFEVAT